MNHNVVMTFASAIIVFALLVPAIVFLSQSSQSKSDLLIQYGVLPSNQTYFDGHLVVMPQSYRLEPQTAVYDYAVNVDFGGGVVAGNIFAVNKTANTFQLAIQDNSGNPSAVSAAVQWTAIGKPST